MTTLFSPERNPGDGGSIGAGGKNNK